MPQFFTTPNGESFWSLFTYLIQMSMVVQTNKNATLFLHRKGDDASLTNWRTGSQLDAELQ